MKTEITFAQVAHLYLRSDLTIQVGEKKFYNLPTFATYMGRSFFDVEEYEGVTPIFTPFENLIKSTKANQFVAELLGINEGDEYVMATYLIRKMTNDMSFTKENKKDGRYLINWDDGNTWGLLIDDTFQTGIVCESYWQTLLIAAGYNVFNIKDCKYDTHRN